MDELHIGSISPDDWKKVRDIRIRAVTEEPAAFGENPVEAGTISEAVWRERLASGQYLFVKRGEELLGMGCQVIEKNEKSKHIAWIYGVYIAPEIRGKGWGKKLLSALVELARKQHPGLIKVMLNASATQTAAIALYESLGFTRVGVLEKEIYVDGSFIDEVMFVKFVA